MAVYKNLFAVKKEQHQKLPITMFLTRKKKPVTVKHLEKPEDTHHLMKWCLQKRCIAILGCAVHSSHRHQYCTANSSSFSSFKMEYVYIH